MAPQSFRVETKYENLFYLSLIPHRVTGEHPVEVVEQHENEVFCSQNTSFHGQMTMEWNLFNIKNRMNQKSLFLIRSELYFFVWKLYQYKFVWPILCNVSIHKWVEVWTPNLCKGWHCSILFLIDLINEKFQWRVN